MLQAVQPLKSGDTVAIVAPCGLNESAQVEVAARTASEMHLVPVVFPSCRKRPIQATFEDTARADDLNHAFFDAGIRAIWAIGCNESAFRLMQKLRFRTAAMHPKLFCGPISASPLHMAYNSLSGLTTIQTPDLGKIAWSEMELHTKTLLSDMLFGTEWPDPLCSQEQAMTTLAKGVCEGELIGGTLESVCATLGTPYEIKAKDCILMLDSLEDSPERVNRMLVQLKHAGKFEDCSGVLLGKFARCSSAAVSFAQDLILDEGKPVLFGASLGPDAPCLSVPLGKAVRMDASSRVLKILSSRVSN